MDPHDAATPTPSFPYSAYVPHFDLVRFDEMHTPLSW